VALLLAAAACTGDLLHSTAWETLCDRVPEECTGGASSAGGSGNGGDGGDGAGASGSGSGAGPSSSGSGGASSVSSSGTGATAGCGNGNIDAGEECDDANDIAGDGCESCLVICVGSFETKDPSTAHCYRAEPMGVGTWDQARTGCLDWGGDLVAIGSSAEQGFVASLVATSSWLGATDVTVEGTFGWINGELWTYTNWNMGEPNNSLEEDCSMIYGPETMVPGLWNDIACTAMLPAVCERRPPEGG